MFTVFLCSGLRLRELNTLRWIDIDWEKGHIKVQPRPEYDWVPKKYHTRSVPISDALLKELRERKLTAKHDIIFPTQSGKPNTHIWAECQAIFKKTKVDMVKAHPHCFRGTFCTTLFREGWDLPSIMYVMGHDPKYPEVTMRYAVALKNDQMRDKMVKTKFAVAA
jgi:integrase